MTDNPTAYEFALGDETYRVKMADLTIDDWCAVEEQSGMDAGEIFSRFLTGGMRARKAMYWLARRQSGSPVEWDSDELNFRLGDMVMRDITKQTKKAAGDEETSKPDPPKKTGTSRSPTRSRATNRTS